MIKLSKREAEILARLLAGRPGEWTLDEIAEICFGRAKPPNWRIRTAEIMRWLCAKTRNQPERIERTSPLGRGRKATYRVFRGEEK